MSEHAANPFNDDGPGRPVERIDRMLDLLRAAWMRFPDQRLGQVIVNAARDPERDNGFGSGVIRDPFNLEDDEMWVGLERMAQPTTEPTFTLAEATRELARRECAMHGHDWTVHEVLGRGPMAIVCDRCGVVARP